MGTPTHLDISGEEVKVGDAIAVARRSGNTATLRLGQVVELLGDGYTDPRGQWYPVGLTAKVRWLIGRSLPQARITTIDWHSERIAKVV